MPGILHILETVITGDLLSREHESQEELRVSSRAILTPTAWDYVRDSGLRLTRTDDPGGSSADGQGDRAEVAEIRPDAMDETAIVQRGRCEHPDQAFGCKTDEFGSGFVQPGSCEECATSRERKDDDTDEGCGKCGVNLAGSDPSDDPQIEALIQRITDEVLSRLEEL